MLQFLVLNRFRSLQITATSLLSILGLISFALPAWALERARIDRPTNAEILRHQGGNVFAQNQAMSGDFIAPLDRFRTTASGLAQIWFTNQNVGLRQGSNTVSWFRSETACRIYLQTGTALSFLRRPGGCSIDTPEGTAYARSTAFFVRHSPETRTTQVGVLTNSTDGGGSVEVTGREGDRTVELRAGQVATIQDGVIAAIDFFDLQRFYDTSDLAAGLGPGQDDLIEREPPDVQEVLREVREETLAALDDQSDWADVPDIPDIPSCFGIGTAPCGAETNSSDNPPPQ